MRHQRMGRVRALKRYEYHGSCHSGRAVYQRRLQLLPGLCIFASGLGRLPDLGGGRLFAGPQLASLLSANRGVTEMLATYTDAGSLVGDYSLATTQVSGMSAGLIQTVLKSVSLPDSIAAILQSNLSSAAFASAGMTTVNDYVSYTIVAVVLQSFSFVVCYFISFILLHAAVGLIGHVFYFPVLKHF